MTLLTEVPGSLSIDDLAKALDEAGSEIGVDVSIEPA
jgi:hypothetical protein